MKKIILPLFPLCILALFNANIAAGVNTEKSSAADEIQLVNSPEEFTISVYPNPNNGKFELLTSGKGEIKEVMIYNIIGERVFHTLTDDISLKVDVSGLDKGVYMLQLYNKAQNKMLTKRFYIE